MIRIIPLSGMFYPFVFGLLNHGDSPTTPAGPSLVDVWKELYKLRDQVANLQIQNKEIEKNQTALYLEGKAQNERLQAQINGLQTENMELRTNQTVMQTENSALKTDIASIQAQTLQTHLQTQIEDLRNNQTTLQKQYDMFLNQVKAIEKD